MEHLPTPYSNKRRAIVGPSGARWSLLAGVPAATVRGREMQNGLEVEGGELEADTLRATEIIVGTSTVTNSTIDDLIVKNTATVGEVATENGVRLTSVASGSNPSVASVGTDTNVTLDVNAKGSGSVNIAKHRINYVNVSGNNSLNDPVIQAVGEANVNLRLAGSGTGSIYLPTNRNNFVQVVGSNTASNGGATIAVGAASDTTGPLRLQSVGANGQGGVHLDVSKTTMITAVGANNEASLSASGGTNPNLIIQAGGSGNVQLSKNRHNYFEFTGGNSTTNRIDITAASFGDLNTAIYFTPKGSGRTWARPWWIALVNNSTQSGDVINTFKAITWSTATGVTAAWNTTDTVTLPETGYYRCSYMLSWNLAGGGTAESDLLVNGTTVVGGGRTFGAVASGANTLVATKIFPGSAGQTVVLRYRFSTEIATNRLINNQNGAPSTFSIEYLSP
jgi:hypothetical protein